MSYNFPSILTQGATLTGLAPRCEEEKQLWLAAFLLREAVLIAPEDLTEAEGKLYFTTAFNAAVSIVTHIRRIAIMIGCL